VASGRVANENLHALFHGENDLNENGNVDGEEMFCAERTRQGGDPIYGTATRVQTWFLLEYRRPRRAKAVTDNDLPQAVQEFLAEQLMAVPGSRLLFIKQENLPQDTLRFFVVRSDENSPETFEVQLHSYEELLNFDIQGVAKGGNEFGRFKRGRPLFLVCTNGTRDKCCARFGLPFYNALVAQRGADVWQSSHIGGHRYAPNVLVLPYGVNYGLMAAGEAGPAVEAVQAGQIFDLSRYRGRTYYAPVVQAADYFLRQKLGYMQLSGVALLGVQEAGDGISLVTFQIANRETHQVRVQQEMTPEPQLVSCSAPQSKAVPRFKLV
jgi:hypothetical protein